MQTPSKELSILRKKTIKEEDQKSPHPTKKSAQWKHVAYIPKLGVQRPTYRARNRIFRAISPSEIRRHYFLVILRKYS
jgi:hypothetical protein